MTDKIGYFRKNLAKPGVKVALLILSFLFGLSFYLVMLNITGLRGYRAIFVLPVLLIGLFWGKWPGVWGGLCVAVALMFLNLIWGEPKQRLDLFHINFIGFVMLPLLGGVVGRLSDLNRQLKTALSEIKELKGLLPVCAKCKNIRNDDGYW
ncbi:MAG: hypothetical protein GY765_36900, partial [bacterium]|nr:hypothetical protein [bacterium]